MEISIPAVLGAVSNMILGFLWYGPLFGANWLKLVKMSKDDMAGGKSKMPMLLGLNFVGALVEAHVLAYLVTKLSISTVMGGVILGLWIALGFVATTMGANYLYTNKPRSLYLIDFGYHFVALLIMGGVIAYLS